MTVMSTWTVYDHPIDAPDRFVARRFEVHAGHSFPTTDVMSSTDLYELRIALAERGLVSIDARPIRRATDRGDMAMT